MALLHISSPHAHKPGKTNQVMLQVILATLPGLATLCYLFGWGPLVNALLAIILALGFEALVLKLRQIPVGFYLSDLSAVLTALLLALALPPFTPWWVTLVGMFFAIVIAAAADRLPGTADQLERPRGYRRPAAARSHRHPGDHLRRRRATRCIQLGHAAGPV
jgi:hypothetical protein